VRTRHSGSNLISTTSMLEQQPRLQGSAICWLAAVRNFGSDSWPTSSCPVMVGSLYRRGWHGPQRALNRGVGSGRINAEGIKMRPSRKKREEILTGEWRNGRRNDLSKILTVTKWRNSGGSQPSILPARGPRLRHNSVVPGLPPVRSAGPIVSF
jgi:hypothetical protein